MGATAAGTTAIETSHHIAMLCKHVEPIIVTIAIAICHLLVTRASIYIEEQWIALGGIKVRRENNIIVQLCTQSGGQGAESLVADTILFHAFLKVGIILKGLQQFAVAGMQCIHWWGIGIGKGADVIFA